MKFGKVIDQLISS